MTIKKKIPTQFEFPLRSSPKILFGFLSTADGLEEWFADKVTIKDGNYIFHWDGEERKAKIIAKKDNQFIKFNWINEDQDTYLEFNIVTDELTNDVSLMITDFCLESEKKETQQLWSSQIHDLMHISGS